MKKVLFILTTVICMFFCISVHAEDNVMKISMDGTVKQAKEIGGGKGISFTLPELDDADYYIIIRHYKEITLLCRIVKRYG